MLEQCQQMSNYLVVFVVDKVHCFFFWFSNSTSNSLSFKLTHWTAHFLQVTVKLTSDVKQRMTKTTKNDETVWNRKTTASKQINNSQVFTTRSFL